MIAAAIDDLDEKFAAEAELAEEFLIGEAATHDAHGLRTLGERLFATIDPDGAEAYEARLLAEQEERARKKPTPTKLGHAFLEYIGRYPSEELPKMGGLAATVIITAQAEVSTQDAQKPGRTESGAGVSPGQLIRLACEAKLMPAILDTEGHVLDLGRAVRFHTGPQRIALIVAQKHCQATGCDIPGAFCHVHHANPWSKSGHTNTRYAALLCPFHHHQAHTHDIDHPIRTWTDHAVRGHADDRSGPWRSFKGRSRDEFAMRGESWSAVVSRRETRAVPGRHRRRAR